MRRDGDLPTGTVTFLLTDVEGSTRLWEDRPDDMAIAVPRHYEIVDDAIAVHGGVRPVEQGEGDSVVAVFTSALDAVRAAAAAQLALDAELPWLRVRMAVHTGEALVLDDGAYGGTSIIRCARLRACGHGGQVLVSDASATLVADDLGDGVSLVDLGMARLRDLARPERVWQLEVASLDSNFPPLRFLDAPPHNLPVSLSSLVGREAELAEIARLLKENRMVTLAGSGGVGKTRLAQQAAADLLEHHSGGTWWVELAPVATEGGVAAQLASVVRVGSPDADRVVDLITRQLTAVGPTLVVLDNAEHLVDTVAELAGRLLQDCPDLRILITSREPLGIGGEVVWRVPSLATPPTDVNDADHLGDYDAARLFVERARQARPNLVLDHDATRAVASICARLDGIPLAIELAAARARNVPLDRLAAGLDDAFRLLTGGDRTATARQQTLLASIAWSVDLLDDRDAAVLRRLAVFAGAFSLEAAETVTADDELVDRYDVLDALGRLVDKSLVQFEDDAGRYRLLATVRQFGLDRLREHHELADTRTRHAQWCVEWADANPMQRRVAEPAELIALVPDLTASLEWTTTGHPEVALRTLASLGTSLAVLGPPAVHRLCDWILTFDLRTVEPGLWAAGYAHLAGRAWNIGRFEVLELVPDAMAAADPADTATTHYLDGLRLASGLIDGKLAEFSELCERATIAGHDELTVTLTGDLAAGAVVYGNFDLARRLLQVHDEVLGRWGLPAGPSLPGYGHVATLYLAFLDLRLADARQLVAWETISASEYAFRSAQMGAFIATVLDDAELIDALEAWTDRYDPPVYAASAATNVRCLSALHRGSAAAAADLAVKWWAAGKQNAMIDMTAGDPAITALVAAGRLSEATEMLGSWAAVLGAREEASLPIHTSVLCGSVALVALAEGRGADAQDAAHQMLETAHRAGLNLFTTNALMLLAELAARRGDDTGAARLIAATTAMRERTGYRAPLIGHVIDLEELDRRMAAEQPDAFAEGSRLDLDAAAELAQRMRGQRGRPTIGWDSLTPTERLVAEHAATGATNAQIADQLLISVATVKTHLTRVFTKLGIINRTQLANAASRLPLEHDA